MKLRVVSDGTVTGTKVFSPKGEELPPANVRFIHTAGAIPILELEFVGFEFDATLPAVRRLGPERLDVV